MQYEEKFRMLQKELLDKVCVRFRDAHEKYQSETRI